MQKIEGLYTALTAIIKERESEGHLAIDVKSIIEQVRDDVDVYSASLDWYISNVLRAAAEVTLYNNGYRSVVKGEGLFVNVDNCQKEEYIKRLFNNAKETEVQKQRVVAFLLGRIKTLGLSGQMSFDLDGKITEDITEKELIEMLMTDAMGA